MPSPGRSLTDKPTKGKAPARRNEEARSAVLRAADDLLVEKGYAGVTIEGIAKRAGVAKQTIYRWWPSKADVLLETLVEDAEAALAVPDTGDVRADVREHLRRLARFFTEAPAGQVLRALIGQSQHDHAMAAAFREIYMEPRRELSRQLLRRGVERGQLDAGLDLELTLDLLYGPVFLRALVSGLPLDPGVTDAVVERVLN